MKAIYGLIVLLCISHAFGVIRGKDAWPDEVYFMIALTDTVEGNITCGGVVIAPEWILTAASCAQTPKGMGAVAGLYYTVSLWSDKWQKRQVDFGITHEEYVVGEPHNDIALLHVSEPFVWTEYVRPPVMPQPGEIPQGEVTFFGYGQSVIATDSYAIAIQRLIVDTMDWHQCRQLLPQDLLLDDHMVCTEQIARQSFCRGDHGGPLVIARENDISLLVGIASWAYAPCGLKSYPNVYTQVSLYLDWINKNIIITY